MTTRLERWREFEGLEASQQRVYRACGVLVKQGIWPGPTAIRFALDLPPGHMLNGRQCAARTMFFRHHGFVQNEPGGRWRLPGRTLWRRIDGKGQVLHA